MKSNIIHGLIVKRSYANVVYDIPLLFSIVENISENIRF